MITVCRWGGGRDVSWKEETINSEIWVETKRWKSGLVCPDVEFSDPTAGVLVCE